MRISTSANSNCKKERYNNLFGVLLPDESILKDKNGKFLMYKTRDEILDWVNENNYSITDGMSFVRYAGECIFCGNPIFKEIHNGHIIKCKECDGTFKF